jgi:hypothetical protein
MHWAAVRLPSSEPFMHLSAMSADMGVRQQRLGHQCVAKPIPRLADCLVQVTGVCADANRRISQHERPLPAAEPRLAAKAEWFLRHMKGFCLAFPTHRGVS